MMQNPGTWRQMWRLPPNRKQMVTLLEAIGEVPADNFLLAYMRGHAGAPHKLALATETPYALVITPTHITVLALVPGGKPQHFMRMDTKFAVHTTVAKVVVTIGDQHFVVYPDGTRRVRYTQANLEALFADHWLGWQAQ